MKLLFTVPVLAALILSGSADGKKTNRRAAVKKDAFDSDSKKTDARTRRLQQLQFSKRYVTIIGTEDAVFTEGFTGNNGQATLLGSVFYTSGGVYDPEDVLFRPRNAPGNLQFSSGEQPVRFPAARSNFFINGQCTTTSESPGNGAFITGHTCFYNLCLGGGGNNCVNGYAGGPFLFNPAQTSPDGTTLIPPAPFEGTILGGTGSFAGVKGFFTVITRTGRTTPNVQPQFGLISQVFEFFTNIPLPTAPGPALAISSVADASVTASPNFSNGGSF